MRVVFTFQVVNPTSDGVPVKNADWELVELVDKRVMSRWTPPFSQWCANKVWGLSWLAGPWFLERGIVHLYLKAGRLLYSWYLQSSATFFFLDELLFKTISFGFGEISFAQHWNVFWIQFTSTEEHQPAEFLVNKVLHQIARSSFNAAVKKKQHKTQANKLGGGTSSNKLNNESSLSLCSFIMAPAKAICVRPSICLSVSVSVSVCTSVWTRAAVELIRISK